MKEITLYEANNGKRFDTKEECETYEAREGKREQATAILKMLKNICDKSPNCKHCPFNCENDVCFFEVGWTPCNFYLPEFERGEL